MKVGDIVRLSSAGFHGSTVVVTVADDSTDPLGPGIIVNTESGGYNRKNISYEVLWSKTHDITWHVEPYLEIIHEGG